MIKWEHSVFALPFAYLGLFLAAEGGGWPSLRTFFWVTLAMVSFRTMAMSANRLMDQAIDAQNPRTKNRALPAKKLNPSFVWAFAGVSFLVFEISAYRLGPLCLRLSPAPVLLAWFYPWTKRFTWLSHFVLGMILGIAPYGAWLAAREEFSWIPGLLTLGVLAWVAGFDIIYAMQDEAFDHEHRLYSLPARFGKEISLKVTQVLHLVTVPAWLGAGLLAGRGTLYIAGLIMVSLFLLREHWLVRSYGLERLEEAFFTMNAVVSISVFLAALADLGVQRFFL